MLWIDTQFSLYDAATGEHIPASFPNEEWVPYFKLKETERGEMGASEGKDENGIKGVTQWYFIGFDMYVAIGPEGKTDKELNYIYYNTNSISMNLWIPNEQ